MPLLDKITEQELKEFMDSKIWNLFLDEIRSQQEMLSKTLMTQLDLPYEQIKFIIGVHKGLELITTTPESMESVLAMEILNLTKEMDEDEII